MHGTLARELRRVDKLGVLHESEVPVEIELVLSDTNPGALIVTDRRVLFVRTPLFRKTRMISIPLGRIANVEASEGGFHGKHAGMLTIARESAERHDEIQFQLWSVDQGRAAEIARSIVRERDLAAKRSAAILSGPESQSTWA
jgi:Bacterial PH domain